jgi:hypothetical protein
MSTTQGQTVAATKGRNVVVVGTQWGDEGKGKLVDWLTETATGVVRFQGGHNAGHTLVINGVGIDAANGNDDTASNVIATKGPVTPLTLL